MTSVNDDVFNFLTTAGFNTGTIQDRLYDWLGSKGGTGTLADRQLQVLGRVYELPPLSELQAVP